MVVLDTQAWLWWVHDPKRLSKAAKKAIENAEQTDGIRTSIISVWEIAVKVQLGKLDLPMDIRQWFQRARSYPNLVAEPLSGEDAIASTLLPGSLHRDPADRIIIALARRHESPLVTSDSRMRAYSHVETIW